MSTMWEGLCILWDYGCSGALMLVAMPYLNTWFNACERGCTGGRVSEETDVNFIRRTKNPTELEHSRYLHLYNVYNRSLPS